MGVNVSRVYTGAFVVGVFLAALGALGAHDLRAAGTLGGRDHRQLRGGDHRRLGSIEGAALGAIVVGLARASALWPAAELFNIYIVMAIIWCSARRACSSRCRPGKYDPPPKRLQRLPLEGAPSAPAKPVARWHWMEN